MGIWAPSNTCFLGPPESITQTASRSVQPFWATICKTVRPMLLDHCLSVLSCLSCLQRGQMVGWIKIKLDVQVGLGLGHIVLHGDPAPLPQRGGVDPQFSAHICCGQMAAWIKLSLGMDRPRPRPRGLCVTWGPRSPSQKGEQSPQFSAHIYCGQTARWIKMPLGMKLGFSPGDSVLDGDSAPLPKRGTEPPQFSAHICCSQMAG